MPESRWKELLSHPKTPWIWMALALLLGLPTLGWGLAGDDWMQQLILQGKWPLVSSRGPLLDFFCFIPGTVEGNAKLQEIGGLAWWSDPEIRASFFRPVTVLTHMLDFLLWPEQVWLQHLHSVAWYAASVGVVCLFFRRYGLSLPMAGLAGLLFTLEDTHSFAISWLANRNASICMVFGVGCLWLHRRWRTEGGAALGLASVGCFLLSLLSAEAGIGTLAYLVAWQWIMEDKSLRARLVGLLPYLVVVVAWRLVYQDMGYGVLWSGVYIDPGRQPLRFGIAMLERLPLLMTAQWFQAPIDGSLFLQPWARAVLAGICWITSLAVLRWLWPLLQARRDARFWALGMGLSLIPICASFPMDRVLTFTGLGAFALLALQLEGWLKGEAELTGFQRLLLFLHIPFALLGLLGRPFIWFGILNTFAPPDGATDMSEDQVMVMLQTHDLAGAYMSMIPAAQGQMDGPMDVAMLGPLLTDTRVIRIDAHTLELRPEHGWTPYPLSRLTSSTDRPHAVGEIITRTDYRVEILEITDDGRPLVARFVFHEPLESPRYRWFTYEGVQLTEVTVPAVGEERLLESVLPGF